MPLRANMEPNDFLEIFRQRKWQIIFSTLLVIFGGIAYCVVIPNQYRSSTTILIVPQRVPEKFVSSTVTYGVEERLASTSRKILSRTRLLEVIDELGLFPEKREKIPTEILTKMMRGRIGIDIIKGQDAFVLSFDHEDPQIAMATTSRLASFFIEENLKTREQLAIGTSEFLDTQLEQVKKKLEEQEKKVKRYKLQYMGELPEEMQANLSMLARLQDQRRTNAEAIAKAEDRKMFLQSQVSNLQNQIRTLEGGADDPTDLLIDELLAKRKQLQTLSTKYTPNYPTIVDLRRSIDELEKRIAMAETGALSVDNTQKGVIPLRTRKAYREREEVARLRGQIKSLELDILALKREQNEVQRASESIQAKVARLPQREQEIISLTRDYNNLKKNYDDLLSKKLQAKVSQNLEERQKGETFQVLDDANLPAFPFKPKRKKIMGLTLLAALAFGFGGALGLELLDPTLRRPSDFKQFFDLPVLATIPMIQDARYIRRNTLRRAALIGGIVSFMCVVVAFVIVFREKIITIIQF